MPLVIVKALTEKGFVLYYTGEDGPAWITDDQARALRFAHYESAHRAAIEPTLQHIATGLRFFPANSDHNHP